MTDVKQLPKIDFKQWTKPKEPEPKTLIECLEEAGGFPFVARALAAHPSPGYRDWLGDNAGEEIRITGWCSKYAGSLVAEEVTRSGEDGFIWPIYRRWVLVGHRT